MAIIVGTSITSLGAGGLAPARGQAIRGSHWRAVQSNEHYARARLRELWAWGDGYTTTSASYAVVADEIPIRLSKSSTAALQMEVIGDNIRVQLVEAAAGPGGIVTITAVAGPTSASLASSVTGGSIASDGTTYVRINARVDTAGTGILTAVRLYEVAHTAGTIT